MAPENRGPLVKEQLTDCLPKKFKALKFGVQCVSNLSAATRKLTLPGHTRTLSAKASSKSPITCSTISRMDERRTRTVL